MAARTISPSDRERILRSIVRGERTPAQVAEEHAIDGAQLVLWLDALQAEKKQIFERYQTLAGSYRALIDAVTGQLATIPGGLAKGMRWRIHRDQPSQYPAGTWDLSFQEALRGLLAPGETLFDVGANAGFFALVGASVVGPRGLVVCFEPIAGNCAVIRDAIAINELASCRVAEVAVGDVDGPVAFYRHRNHLLGSMVALQPKAALERIEVTCVRLDTFAATARAPDVIKVDVEGAEDRVLAGAEQLLSASRPPALLLELHSPDSAASVLRVLAHHGYQYAPLADEDAARAGAGADLEVDRLSVGHPAHVIAIRTDDVRLPAFSAGFGAELRWIR